MSEFVVHGVAGSPYLRSALLGFEEKGADYRFAQLPPGGVKSAEHLARHPFGRVPAITHGDFALYEVQAILRYLDAVLPGPALQPSEPKAMARMSQIANIVDWYVMPSISVQIVAERFFSMRFWNRPTDETIIAKAVPEARTCIRALESLKGDSAYLVGDAVTIADLMLAPHLAYFAMVPEGEMLKESSLSEWLDRMASRPSMQATAPERLLAKAA
jgi:glutathione S-transferase